MRYDFFTLRYAFPPSYDPQECGEHTGSGLLTIKDQDTDFSVKVLKYNCDNKRHLHVSSYLGEANFETVRLFAAEVTLELASEQANWAGYFKGWRVVYGITGVDVQYPFDERGMLMGTAVLKKADCLVNVEAEFQDHPTKCGSYSGVASVQIALLGLTGPLEAEVEFDNCDAGNGIEVTTEPAYYEAATNKMFSSDWDFLEAKVGMFKFSRAEEGDDRRLLRESRKSGGSGDVGGIGSGFIIWDTVFAGEVDVFEQSVSAEVGFICSGFTSATLEFLLNFFHVQVNVSIEVKREDNADDYLSWEEFTGNADYSDCKQAQGTVVVAYPNSDGKERKFTGTLLKLWCDEETGYGEPFFFKLEIEIEDTTLGELILGEQKDETAEGGGSLLINILDVDLGEDAEIQLEAVERRTKGIFRMGYRFACPMWGVTTKFEVAFGRQTEEGKSKTIFYIYLRMAYPADANSDDEEAGFLLSFLTELKITEMQFSYSNYEATNSDGQSINEGFSIAGKFVPTGDLAEVAADKDSPFAQELAVGELMVQITLTMGKSKKIDKINILVQYSANITLGRFNLDRVGLILEKSRGSSDAKIGFQCGFAVTFGEGDDAMDLSFELALTLEKKDSKLSIAASLLVGQYCPQITHADFCSKEIFCCWKNPLGMAPGLTVVFPFFFKIGMGITPFSLSEIALQFSCLIGKFSFTIAILIPPPNPLDFALYIKMEKFNLGDILEDFIGCDNCLGALADTILQISIEKLEISINIAKYMVQIGTIKIPMGVVFDVTNFNLWDIIIIKRFYLRVVFLQVTESLPPIPSGFEVKVLIAPIEIPGIIKIGYEDPSGNGTEDGTLFDLKLTTSDFHFKLRGGITILGGLVTGMIALEISPKRLYAMIYFKLGGLLKFKIVFEGKPPFDPPKDDELPPERVGRRLREFRAAGHEQVVVKKPDDRECFTTTRATRWPQSVERQTNCTTLPTSYLLWGNTTGWIECEEGELMQGWKIDPCAEYDEYRFTTTCLRFVQTTEITRRNSKFVDVPRIDNEDPGWDTVMEYFEAYRIVNENKVICNQDGTDCRPAPTFPPGYLSYADGTEYRAIGLRELVKIGEVSCGEEMAISRFTFDAQMNRGVDWPTRGFWLDCIQPNAQKDYVFVEEEKEIRTSDCTVVDSVDFRELAEITSAMQCSKRSALRSFEVQSCWVDSAEGYQIKLVCVPVIYEDKDPNSPMNAKLPVLSFNFADVEGEQVQLTICRGGDLPSVTSTEPLVNVTNSDTNEMICPPSYAMIAFTKEIIFCMNPGVIHEKRKRRWSPVFNIQTTPVDCNDGVVVGYKCKNTGCIDKQVLCQGYHVEGPEEVFLRIEASMAFSLAEFIRDTVAPALRAIFEAAGKALRAAAEQLRKASEKLEQVKADLQRAEEKVNAKLDGVIKKLRKEQQMRGALGEELARRRRAHDKCSFWTCAGTGLSVAGQVIKMAVHYLILEVAILAVKLAKVVVSIALKVAQVAVSVAQVVLEGLAYLAEGIAAVCDAIGEAITEMLESAAEFLDSMFAIRTFTFGTTLTTKSLTVKFELDMTIVGFDIAFKMQMELNWEKLWGGMESDMEDRTNPDSDKGEEEERDLDRRSAEDCESCDKDYGPNKKVFNEHDLEEIRELGLRSVKETIPDSQLVAISSSDDEAATYEMLSRAVNTKVSRRGHTQHTRVENLALDHFGREARKLRKRRARWDELKRRFDTNRGLAHLCDAANEGIRNRVHGTRYGFVTIERTYSVPDSRREGDALGEIPECLFRSNPELSHMTITDVAGSLPELPTNNELKVFSLTSSRVRGNLERVVENGRSLRILHVGDSEFSGRISRSSWGRSLESISLVNNVFQIDPATMFDSLQDLPYLEQVFWDRNSQADDQLMSRRSSSRLSPMATKIRPEFSVLYGVVTVPSLRQDVCGECTIVKTRDCFAYECADQLALARFEDELASTLNAMLDFSHVRVDSISPRGIITFSARTTFVELIAQEDILQGLRESDFFADLGLNARFGCTPGAVGPQCEYVCQTGWRRHGTMYTSLFPQCVEPTLCKVDCSNSLKGAMEMCHEALYNDVLEKDCFTFIGRSKKTCGTCSFFDGTATDYEGTVSRTLNGSKCRHWNKVKGFNPPGEAVWVHNFCRNPPDSERNFAWCFTDEDGSAWDACDVGTPSMPKCRDDGISCFEMSLVQFIAIFR